MYYEFVKVMLLKNKISQNGIVWNGFVYFMYLSACVRCGSALASTGGRGPLVTLPYRHTRTFWRNSAFTNLSK